MRRRQRWLLPARSAPVAPVTTLAACRHQGAAKACPCGPQQVFIHDTKGVAAQVPHAASWRHSAGEQLPRSAPCPQENSLSCTVTSFAAFRCRGMRDETCGQLAARSERHEKRCPAQRDARDPPSPVVCPIAAAHRADILRGQQISFAAACSPPRASGPPCRCCNGPTSG